MYREFKLNELDEVVDDFLKNFRGHSSKVIGFQGNLGAGKTTFTKKLLEKLGYTGSVVSPTFVLRRDYSISRNPFIDEDKEAKVIHIDAYRLEKPEHIYQVVSKEELEDKNNLVIIEWPELVDQSIFDKVYLFEHVDENTRRVSVV